VKSGQSLKRSHFKVNNNGISLYNSVTTVNTTSCGDRALPKDVDSMSGHQFLAMFMRASFNPTSV